MNPKVKYPGILLCLVCLFFMAGCQTQNSRLPVYIGPVDGLKESDGYRPQSLPTILSQVGVLMMTDVAFPDSAQSLSPDMMEILENRLVQKMDKYFSLKAKPIPAESPLRPIGSVTPLTQIAKAHNLDFMLLALLSSTEEESHIEIGEETMMTRMSGVLIENEALAELALLNTESGAITMYAAGEGTVSMEQLAVPIGGDYPRKEDARDILRGNSAEKAMDQALLAMQRQWGRSLVPQTR